MERRGREQRNREGSIAFGGSYDDKFGEDGRRSVGKHIWFKTVLASLLKHRWAQTMLKICRQPQVMTV